MNTDTNITKKIYKQNPAVEYQNKALETRIAQRDKNKEIFLKEFKRSRNIQISCEKCEISRGAYYDWIKEDELFAKKIEYIKEGVLDGLENRVIEIAEQDEKLDVALKATTSYLNAKAKNRGWGKELDSNVNINLVADLRAKVLQAGDNYIDINAELQKDVAQQPVSQLLDSNVSNDRLSIDDEMQDCFKD